MSWLSPPSDAAKRAKRATKPPTGESSVSTSDAPDTPAKDQDENLMVQDPSDSTKMVSSKKANQPFIAYVPFTFAFALRSFDCSFHICICCKKLYRIS